MYITCQAGVVRAEREAGKSHVVIVLRPERFLTTGFFPAKSRDADVYKGLSRFRPCQAIAAKQPGEADKSANRDKSAPTDDGGVLG